jgi:hypothetical protein
LSEFDVVLKGGRIVDGTQVPAYIDDDDIGIRGGRIAEIGRIAPHRGARVLDANGLIAAPGFIDLHTHYDAQIHWDPYCTISGWHGVTSVVLGNCGFGFAPVRPAERDRAMHAMTRNEAIPFASMKAGMKWDWETFPEWLDTLERMPKGVHCKTYVPVSPLMIYVMGLEAAKSRDATEAETREMQRLLAEALAHGACGFSVQRLGPNSIQAGFDGTPMVTDTMSDRLMLGDLPAKQRMHRFVAMLYGLAVHVVAAEVRAGRRVHLPPAAGLRVHPPAADGKAARRRIARDGDVETAWGRRTALEGAPGRLSDEPSVVRGVGPRLRPAVVVVGTLHLDGSPSAAHRRGGRGGKESEANGAKQGSAVHERAIKQRAYRTHTRRARGREG